MNTQDYKIYDVVGIGFGPSSLSLAIAIDEIAPSLDYLFMDIKEKFSWHENMLFKNVDMQVSFLKDLVTFRNPKSQFSFINYLHEKNRLPDFVNLKTFYPTRVEFQDYLCWCESYFRNKILYKTQAIKIEKIKYNNQEILKITINKENNIRTLFTKSIIYSPGLQPRIPRNCQLSSRVIHSYNLLPNLANFNPQDKAEFIVVGGGQSAAEVVEYLYNNYSNINITAIVSSFGYMPSDNSPFVNQIFDPNSVDLFFSANLKERKNLLQLHATTNTGVVDLDLITNIYKSWYAERVSNQNRLKFINLSKITLTSEDDNAAYADIFNQLSTETSKLKADYIVLATGFTPHTIIPLLSPELSESLLLNEENEVMYSQKYKVQFKNEQSLIYCTGIDEKTYGLTATLISIMAVRSGIIVNDIVTQLKNK